MALRGIAARADTPAEVRSVLVRRSRRLRRMQVRKMMTDMGMIVLYMEGKQAGNFWDELEGQTKPPAEPAK